MKLLIKAWSGLEIDQACTPSLHSLLHSQFPQGKMLFLASPLNFSFQRIPAVSHPSTMLCEDQPGSLLSIISFGTGRRFSWILPKAFTKNLGEVQAPQPLLPGMCSSPGTALMAGC